MGTIENEEIPAIRIPARNRCGEEDFEAVVEKGILDAETLGANVELQDVLVSDDKQKIPSSKHASTERDGESRPEAENSGGADRFDEDHISCYLREVANYPLLSAEREIELAKRIRAGQDRLVRLVKEHHDLDEIISELDRKVQKLLAHSKEFPGVRDKVLKVIDRTLAKAATDHPENEMLAQLHRRAEAIMADIDAAKHEMVRSNLRLVLSIAKRYRGRGMSFDDLIQEGNLGLMKAVGRYDHTKGNRFSTYATWWVRQSIIRGIYDKTRTIRLPVHFIELKNLFYKVFHELMKELGREPTPQEIAERAELPLEKVQSIMTLMANPISLETPIGDEEQKLSDFIQDDKAESPVEGCESKELSAITRELLACLQPREERILRLRFGLNGQPGETLEKIGKTFKVSKERIRQIEKKALRKLRHPNRQELLKAFLE